MNKQRDKLIDYTVFGEGRELLGTADVSLPDIEYLSDTIKGAGIGGEVDLPTLGHTKSLTVSLNWRTISSDVTKLTALKTHSLEFRGAQQIYNANTGELEVEAVSVQIKGLPKKTGTGKFEGNSTTGTSTDMECTYYKLVVNGDTKIEIDKFNYVHIVDGIDYLSAVREALGK